jgi:hypothetical protein
MIMLRGFSAFQAECCVIAAISPHKEVGLRFRSEFFNILTTRSSAIPKYSLPSPLFGRSTQTVASSLGSSGANGDFNPLYQIGGPRSIQLALKLQF